MSERLENWSAGGYELNVRVVGGPGARPAVLLHGFPDLSDTWSPVMANLCGDRPLFAPDLPGVGRNQAFADRSSYHTDRLVPLILDALEARFPEPVHLVGHDWGGLIGWRLLSDPRAPSRVASFSAIAAPHPDLVWRLAARNLRHPTTDRLAGVARQLGLSWYIGWFQVPRLPELAWRRRAPWRRAEILGRAGLAPDDPLRLADAEVVRSSTVPAIELYRQLARSWVAGPPRPETRVPCRVLVPVRDFCIDPRTYDNLCEFVPQAAIATIDANHWCHRTHTAAVAAWLSEGWKAHD